MKFLEVSQKGVQTLLSGWILGRPVLRDGMAQAVATKAPLGACNASQIAVRLLKMAWATKELELER